MSRRGRMPQHGDDSPWKVLLKVLQALNEQLEANEVPKFLRRKLFLQLFSFINVQLFNQLLLRRECCSFANGEYVKQGLGQVRFQALPWRVSYTVLYCISCSVFEHYVEGLLWIISP